MMVPFDARTKAGTEEESGDFFRKQLMKWYLEVADFREKSPLLDQELYGNDQIEVQYDLEELCHVWMNGKKGKQFSYNLLFSEDRKKNGLKKTLLCLNDKEHSSRAINTMLRKSRLASDRKYGIYFCVGQICWVDSSAGSHHAPLYLIPAILSHHGTEYQLKPDMEKLIWNESLIQFIEKAYQLDLKSGQAVISVEMLKQIQEKITRFAPSWKLEPDKGWIGYQEPVFLTAWENLMQESCRKSNTLLRQLVSGSFLEKKIEKVSVRPTGFAFDLNSLQKKAVDSADRNTVTKVSGPSKSGRTRTAAAVAANQLYRGKRILYVSSETEDLDQFKNSMSESGVGQYCLKIDTDTKFQEICAQMNTAVADKKKEVNLHEINHSPFFESSQSAEKLEEFYREMNQTAECGYSLNELIEQYEGYRHIRSNMDFSDVKEAFQSPGALELIKEYMQLLQKGILLEELYQKRTDLSGEEQEILQLLLPQAVEYYDNLEQAIRSFYKKLGISLNLLNTSKWKNIGLYLIKQFKGCIDIEVSEPDVWYQTIAMFEEIILRKQMEAMQNDQKILQEKHHFKNTAFAIKADSIKKLQEELATYPKGERLSHLRKELDKILVIKQKTFLPAQQKEFCSKFRSRLGELVAYYEKYPNEQRISLEQQEKFLSLLYAEKGKVSNYFKSLKKIRSVFDQYGYQEVYDAAAAGLRELTFGKNQELIVLVRKIDVFYQRYRELQNKIVEIMPIKDTFAAEHPEMAQADLFRVWMSRDQFAEGKKKLGRIEAELLAAGLASICKEFQKAGLSAEEACDVYRKCWLKYHINALMEQPLLKTYSREMLKNRVDEMNQEISEQYKAFQKALLMTVRGRFFYAPDKQYDTNETALEAIFQAFPCIAISTDAALYYQTCICKQYDIVILDHAEQLSMADGIPLLAAADRLVLLEDDVLLKAQTVSDTNGLKRKALLSQKAFERLPVQKLLWCYGDREENAIYWKNACVWNNKLLSLPSQKAGRSKIHVDSIPVARCDSQNQDSIINALEAQQIASDVMERCHAQKKGQDITIGVITANEAQAHIVEMELKKRWDRHSKDADAEIFVLPLAQLHGQKWDYIYYSPVYGRNFDDEVYFPEAEMEFFSSRFYGLVEAADMELHIVTGLTRQVMNELLTSTDISTGRMLSKMLFYTVSEQENMAKTSILTCWVTDILLQKGYNISWKENIGDNSFSVLLVENESVGFNGAIVIENQVPDGFTYNEMIRQIPKLLHRNGWNKVDIIRLLDMYDSTAEETERKIRGNGW